MSEYTAEDWLAAVTAAQDELRRVEATHESVVFPPLDELRPAVEADIVLGATIYYPCEEYPEDSWWTSVIEVRWPDDDFKAYVCWEGDSHGLRDAFVRKTTK